MDDSLSYNFGKTWLQSRRRVIWPLIAGGSFGVLTVVWSYILKASDVTFLLAQQNGALSLVFAIHAIVVFVLLIVALVVRALPQPAESNQEVRLAAAASRRFFRYWCWLLGVWAAFYLALAMEYLHAAGHPSSSEGLMLWIASFPHVSQILGLPWLVDSLNVLQSSPKSAVNSVRVV